MASAHEEPDSVPKKPARDDRKPDGSRWSFVYMLTGTSVVAVVAVIAFYVYDTGEEGNESLCPRLTLPTGNAQPMPVVGLGTANSPKDQVEAGVKAALDIGYRHLDCAFNYHNEDAVGRGLQDRIKAGVVTRKDVFVTTKLFGNFHQPDQVEVGVRKSLTNMGLKYVDLFLIHWPMAYKEKGKDKHGGTVYETDYVDFVDTWKAMEEIVDKGLAKSIGVSNFNVSQLTRILTAPGLRIKPANLQIESHPLFSNQELIDFCHSHGITVTAYTPLARGGKIFDKGGILGDKKVADIAARLNRTHAQVVLRWTVQRGLAVIPKSVNPIRIHENFQVCDFTLSQDDMASIASLNRNARMITRSNQKHFHEYPFYS